MHADFAAYDDDPFTAPSSERLRPILTVSLGREVFAGVSLAAAFVTLSAARG